MDLYSEEGGEENEEMCESEESRGGRKRTAPHGGEGIVAGLDIAIPAVTSTLKGVREG